MQADQHYFLGMLNNAQDEMSEDGGEAVVGENDGYDMSEDEGGEVEIQRINNTENDIQEAVTDIMLEYSEGICILLTGVGVLTICDNDGWVRPLL